MQTFKEYIESRRADLVGSDKDRRLGLIETEAMLLAHRELQNAHTLATAFFGADKLTMRDVLEVHGLLSGFYHVAHLELIDKGLIKAPVITVPPSDTTHDETVS